MDGPALPVTTIVRHAARAAIASDHPIRVMDGDQLLGVVDENDIMRVVVAEEET
jgi:glycine betaine/proline transport system ATP-binding protein